jgi:ATP-dependent DNA helicase RecG
MKQRYAEKNDNPGFASVSDEQALIDLDLLVDGKLNYAALVLLGKSKAIKKFLPQNNVVIEYRNDPASIQYDDRIEIQQPLFLAIESIWTYINQPVLNPQVHISEKAYIFDIKLFNKETIREAVLNAIAHRSMIVQNDVVIKQSPNELTITNAGGFPIGVDKSNVLTVNSTPRSKRLAEVLQKTGLVEKSGQGVDKMFTNCIMEAKPLPDFSATDNYQVSLKFRTEIRDVPFLVYIRQEQAKRPRHHKLNVFQLMAIYDVCFGDGLGIKNDTIEELVNEGVLIRAKNGRFSMPKEYQRIYSEIHSIKSVDWLGALKSCAAKYGNEITRKTYMEYLPDWISIDRVRYTLSKLEVIGVLKRYGVGKGTKYSVVKIPESIEL